MSVVLHRLSYSGSEGALGCCQLKGKDKVCDSIEILSQTDDFIDDIFNTDDISS